MQFRLSRKRRPILCSRYNLIVRFQILLIGFILFHFHFANASSEQYRHDFNRISLFSPDHTKISISEILSATSNPAGTLLIFPGVSARAEIYFPFARLAAAAGYDSYILEPRYSHLYSPLPLLNPLAGSHELIDLDFYTLAKAATKLARNKETHWMGHSFGAVAAMAILNPEIAESTSIRPRSLVCAGATSDFGEMKTAARAINAAAGVLSAVSSPWVHLMPLWAMQVLSPGRWGSTPLDLIREISLFPDVFFKNREGKPYVDESVLTLSILAIAGDHDPFVSPLAVQKFAARLPFAKSHLIAEATHLSIFEKHREELWAKVASHFSELNSCEVNLASRSPK